VDVRGRTTLSGVLIRVCAAAGHRETDRRGGDTGGREPRERAAVYALFFYVGWRLRTDVARMLGCQLRDDGSIAVDSEQKTTVDRVYAAGNCADPRALVPTAAGSGVTAAVAINVRLSLEDADRAVAGSRAPASEVR
jgi:thioredoxin reductase